MEKRGEAKIIGIMLILALCLFGLAMIFAFFMNFTKDYSEQVNARANLIIYNKSVNPGVSGENNNGISGENNKFHAIMLYRWGNSGVPADYIQEVVSETNANVIVLAGDISGGLQESIENMPPGMKYILQPSPLTISSDKDLILSGEDLDTKYNILESIITDDCIGVIIVHEKGIRNPNPDLEAYFNKFIDFLQEKNIEPVLLLDSPGYEEINSEIMQTDIPDKASIWAEVRPSIWTCSDNRCGWAWGETEGSVTNHVKSRISQLTRSPQGKLDAVLIQFGWLDNFYSLSEAGRDWKWPEPTEQQVSWTIDEINNENWNNKVVIWHGGYEQDWKSVMDDSNFASRIKNWWTG